MQVHSNTTVLISLCFLDKNLAISVLSERKIVINFANFSFISVFFLFFFIICLMIFLYVFRLNMKYTKMLSGTCVHFLFGPIWLKCIYASVIFANITIKIKCFQPLIND